MTRQPITKNTKHTGFSLLELTVVLTIIGILLYMALSIGAAQQEIAKIKSTQEKLAKIQNALIVFYQVNGRLPCPADGTNPTSGTNSDKFGKEQATILANDAKSNSTCSSALLSNLLPPTTVYAGVVPTRSLGLADDTMVDAWNGRITYAVSKNCLDPDNWDTTNKLKCLNSTGTADGQQIKIYGKNLQPWASVAGVPVPNAAYLLISHGKNGFGAWNRTGTKVPFAYSSVTPDPAESVNGNSGYSSDIYWDKPISDGDLNYFDDLTAWASAPQIDYNATH